MPRQTGIFPLKGKMGDFVFYEFNGQPLVRGKGSLTKERIEKEPAFEKTRKLNTDFGKGSSAAKLIRTAFAAPLLDSSTPTTVNRLTQELYKIVQADTINSNGSRIVQDSNMGLLTGFDFNDNCFLKSIFRGKYSVDADSEKQELTVRIPAFTGPRIVSAPIGSTHFKVFTHVAAFDFANNDYSFYSSSSSDLVSVKGNFPDTELTHTIPVDHGILVTVMGIVFYQDMSGEVYKLRNKAFSPLKVIDLRINISE